MLSGPPKDLTRRTPSPSGDWSFSQLLGSTVRAGEWTVNYEHFERLRHVSIPPGDSSTVAAVITGVVGCLGQSTVIKNLRKTLEEEREKKDKMKQTERRRQRRGREKERTEATKSKNSSQAKDTLAQD